MYPIQAQALSKVDVKLTITSFGKIGFDTEKIGVSKRERVSCDLWEHIGADKPILNDCTVIDIECDCVVRCVLISEVHLMELCRGIVTGSIPHWRVPIVIGIPHDQVDGHQGSINVTWQVGFEDGVRATIATEGHPDLDTAICDWKYIKVVCVGRRQFGEFFDEFVVVH